jgi:hypothetical protein
MKKNLILVALALVVIVGGYFLVNKKADDSVASTLKTYRNETYGFEFSYPKSFEFQEKLATGGIRVVAYPVPQPVEFGPLFSFLVSPASESLGTLEGLISSESVIINGQAWTKKYGVGAEVPQKYWQWSRTQGDKAYTMMINSDSDEFMKIVASAKLDSVSTAAGFKEYSDTQLKLSFQYPASWPAPTKSTLSTRTSINVGQGISIESGVYYNQNLDRGMTIDELVKSVGAGVTQQDITVGGKSAVKASHVGAAGELITQIYVSTDSKGGVVLIKSSGGDEAAFAKLVSSFKFL